MAELVRHGLHHPRMVVANVHDANASYEIEIAFAVRVEDMSTFAARNDKRVSGQHPASHVALALGQ